MPRVRTRKPVVDYRFSRPSCRHGTESIVGRHSLMFSWRLRVVCLFVLISGTAYGQTAIEGTVHNAAGRVVAKESVSLQHQDGGIAQTTVSRSEGTLRFPGLERGA